MILDAETLDLANAIESMLQEPPVGEVKPELMESVLEVATEPCRDVGEAADAARARCAARCGRPPRAKGLAIGSAGTHPFAMWEDQRIVARPPLPRPHQRPAASSRARSSCSASTSTSASTTPTRRSTSPTGCASTSRCCSPCRPTRPSGAATRAAWRRRARRSSGPSRAWASRRPTPTGRTTRGGSTSWSAPGVIQDYTYLWYDVRPHPRLGTVEVRCMDGQTRVEHTLALAALVQAMVEGAGRALRRRPGAEQVPVRDARREQVARRAPRARGRARRPAEHRQGRDQGPDAAGARPGPRARAGPRLGRRAGGHRRPPASAGTGPRARSSSTRPTTTCARSCAEIVEATAV